jgi:hypothetical protein
MVDRVITKNLAGLEDLLLGAGQENQVRSGDTYPITKLMLVWPCSSIEELADLDVDKFKWAYYNGQVYKYDGSVWQKDSPGHLSIELACGSDQAVTSTLSLLGYSSLDVLVFYTSTLAPISLQGYAFKNGSVYAVETSHNSGGFPGAGALSMSEVGTDLVISKTAGSTVGAGNLRIVLRGILYA